MGLPRKSGHHGRPEAEYNPVVEPKPVGVARRRLLRGRRLVGRVGGTPKWAEGNAERNLRTGVGSDDLAKL